jgi:ABC-type lipoprotein release transport system permease subunit
LQRARLFGETRVYHNELSLTESGSKKSRMNYELLIGLRYTRAQPREGASNRFISFIALISMLGLALGVAALIVVLSVMNGFQKELRERILGVVSHVQISSPDGENWPTGARWYRERRGTRGSRRRRLMCKPRAC